MSLYSQTILGIFFLHRFCNTIRQVARDFILVTVGHYLLNFSSMPPRAPSMNSSSSLTHCTDGRGPKDSYAASSSNCAGEPTEPRETRLNWH